MQKYNKIMNNSKTIKIKTKQNNWYKQQSLLNINTLSKINDFLHLRETGLYLFDQQMWLVKYYKQRQ